MNYRVHLDRLSLGFLTALVTFVVVVGIFALVVSIVFVIMSLGQWALIAPVAVGVLYYLGYVLERYNDA